MKQSEIDKRYGMPTSSEHSCTLCDYEGFMILGCGGDFAQCPDCNGEIVLNEAAL